MTPETAVWLCIGVTLGNLVFGSYKAWRVSDICRKEWNELLCETRRFSHLQAEWLRERLERP